MLAEATGDVELVLWDGREFGHWSLEFVTGANHHQCTDVMSSCEHEPAFC